MREHVVEIRLANPEKLNAFTLELVEDLEEVTLPRRATAYLYPELGYKRTTEMMLLGERGSTTRPGRPPGYWPTTRRNTDWSRST